MASTGGPAGRSRPEARRTTMFDTIRGLPVHALVVHAVVVLVPLAAVGLIAIAVRPSWRRAYAPVVVILATIGLALVPVATRSGAQARGAAERRRRRRQADPGPRADGASSSSGRRWPCGWSRWPLLVMDRRGGTGRPMTVLAVVAVVVALAAAGSGRHRRRPRVDGRLEVHHQAPADRLSRPRARPGCAAAGAARPAGPGRCAPPPPSRPGRTRARRGCTTAGSRPCPRPGRGTRG